MESEQCIEPIGRVGVAVASWLVSSTPDRAVLARALVGDIVLCSLGMTLDSHSALLRPGV